MIFAISKPVQLAGGMLRSLMFDDAADYTGLLGIEYTAPGSTAYGPVRGGNANLYILSAESGVWEVQ